MHYNLIILFLIILNPSLSYPSTDFLDQQQILVIDGNNYLFNSKRELDEFKREFGEHNCLTEDETDSVSNCRCQKLLLEARFSGILGEAEKKLTHIPHAKTCTRKIKKFGKIKNNLNDIFRKYWYEGEPTYRGTKCPPLSTITDNCSCDDRECFCGCLKNKIEKKIKSKLKELTKTYEKIKEQCTLFDDSKDRSELMKFMFFGLASSCTSPDGCPVDSQRLEYIPPSTIIMIDGQQQQIDQFKNLSIKDI